MDGALLSLFATMFCLSVHGADHAGGDIPSSWEVVPIPRYVEYGSTDEFLTLGRVALVRRQGGPYQTLRDDRTELVDDSTITEEELAGILKGHGVAVDSQPDNLKSYDGFDTLVLLGRPRHNEQTAKYFTTMGLSFESWDDPNTPEDDFEDWPDLGKEGYVLKAGRTGEKNIVILAGYDFDDARGKFHGAGTFYAMQTLRQMVVKEDGTVKLKVAEIADKPLLAIRGFQSGWPTREARAWSVATTMPRLKANQNMIWYGSQVVGYNAESASRFRYPWRPDQLEFCRRLGKYCRERFVTMVFCMNPDHYRVDWAAPKTFDGSKKDPVHYDPSYRVEPEFKEMWAKLGYEVENDIDIVVAKFGQLNKAVPGAALQMMNEDDAFNLVHDADKKLFNTETGDLIQDRINYGRARAQFLATVYKRIRKEYPDSAEYLPFCLPGDLSYLHVIERDEDASREFLGSLGATLKELGVMEQMPLITTGGGTAPEVTTNKQIEDFRKWANGSPVLITDNNFHTYHAGAYELDPDGPRSPHQVDKRYPAGFRNRDLYKRLWGIQSSGQLAQHQYVLGWCQSQFMWNMLAYDREKMNALSVRKFTTAESYPLVKSFYEEFDNPNCYCLQNKPPYRVLAVSDRVVFPSKGPNAWPYDITFTDPMRKECQRLRDKLSELIPELERKWENRGASEEALRVFGYNAYCFCTVYLAYGYSRGWEGGDTEGRLRGADLRDLYLEAQDIQQRFLVGPVKAAGRARVHSNVSPSGLHVLYGNGHNKPAPKAVAEAEFYMDIWEKGLREEFFEVVSSVNLAKLSDQDPMLVTGWGPVEEADGQGFRTTKIATYPTGRACLSCLDIKQPSGGRFLVRMDVGGDRGDRAAGTKIFLSTSGTSHDDAVSGRRWVHWLLPAGTNIDQLTIEAEKPVRVYSVEVYRERG